MKINAFAVTTTVVSTTLAFFAVCSLAVENTIEWKCEVAGLRVVAPAWGGKNAMRAFNHSDGVTVALLLTAPTGNIVGINREASIIMSFTDDKGTDLLGGAARKTFRESVFSRLDWDGGGLPAALLEVDTSGRPARDATELRISGKVSAQTASQTKQVTAENVELKPGAQFDLDVLKLTISDVHASGDGNSVSFEAKQSLSSLLRLEFFDAQGKKLESTRSGHSSRSSGSEMRETRIHTIKAKPERIKVVATFWRDLKTTEVPFSIKTGLGL